MSNNNGKITAPVSQADIKVVLGISTNSLAEACQSDNICKWSKKKPFVWPYVTAPNCKGTPEQNSLGIFYGLQAGVGYKLDSSLHSANWTYYKPTGGIGASPFRRLFFDGYNHSARPTIYGQIITSAAGKVIYTDTVPFTFKLHWNYLNNTDGVDIFDCAPDNAEALNMADWYLCVLIDGTATAMLSANGTREPISQYDSGDTQYKCPALPSSLRAVASRNVTFFLADLEGSNLPEVQALRTGWSTFTSDTKVDIFAITVPEAAGYALEWASTAVDYTRLIRFTASYSATSGLFTFEADWEDKPTQDMTYIAYITLTSPAGETSPTVTATYTGGGSSKDTFSVRVPKAQFGFRIDSGTYTYSITVYGYNNSVQSQESVGSATGVLTIN